MIAAISNRYKFLRAALIVLLIFSIGSKIVVPVLLQIKLPAKEISASAEGNDNEGEKKSETNILEKENVFASFHSCLSIHFLWNTEIEHLTAYNNNYKTSYYSKITIPPPDRS